MPLSEYLRAIILGVIQGVAEFLPISSSGHLVIFGDLLQHLGLPSPGNHEDFQLTVALHVGTLLSILVVYRNDLKSMFRRLNLARAIVLATIPLVVIGLCLTFSKPIKEALDALFSNVMVAGIGLLVTATILSIGRQLERGEQELDDVRSGQAVLVGLFQTVAIVPGISRSGSTIAGGLIGGLRRDAATTFSFLIAIPAITGGGVLAAKDAWEGNGGDSSIGVLLVGMTVSFAFGLLALRWLIQIVAQQRLHWFAWYCGCAGAATILWQLIAHLTAST